MWQIITAILSTVSWYTVLILVLSNGFTLACYYSDTTFEMRTDIVSLAVVFPLVFSINSAFQRREQAIQHLARMKADAYSIRFAFYHWLEGKFLFTQAITEIDDVFYQLFHKTSDYFISDEFSETDYMLIMELFQKVSWKIEEHLRAGGVPPPNISMLCGNLKGMMSSFELLRNIKLYRTPLALRAYTKLFVSFFPVLFSPLFAYIAKDQEKLWGALVTVSLFALILVGLDTIQDGLEEPFDGLGIDDVQFDQYPRHMTYPVITPGVDTLSFDDNEQILVKQVRPSALRDRWTKKIEQSLLPPPPPVETSDSSTNTDTRAVAVDLATRAAAAIVAADRAEEASHLEETDYKFFQDNVMRSSNGLPEGAMKIPSSAYVQNNVTNGASASPDNTLNFTPQRQRKSSSHLSEHSSADDALVPNGTEQLARRRTVTEWIMGKKVTDGLDNNSDAELADDN